jgi:LPXTG-site transpeptidase (sortase) family protein
MDEDGAVSSGDAPALNMLVALYMDDGDQVFDAESDLSIGEEATDAEGAYLFEQLEAGEYWVVVDTSTLPEEAVPDQQIEPQAVTAPGVVNFLLVAQTQLNTDLAEGAGRLTGKAFNDNNGNRVWDGDVESGLRYVDIVLYFDTGDSVFDPATDQEIDRVTTDWDGIYTFDQLGEGRYWVWLDESTMPENYIDSIAYGNHGIQNPQEVVLSDLPEGIFVNARVDVEGPWFAYTLDTDSDGSPDGIEGSGDRDSDGIPNYLDSYDPSGTVFSWDDTHAPAYSSAVSGVRIGLYVDEGNGVYDGTEAPAIVFQTNPQVTGADGAYRFDIVSGLPAPPASATFLLVIDEASLPEGYSFGLTPASSVTPPWMPQPTLNVGSTGFPYEVSLDPYPPNTFNEPYHIAFTLQQGDDEVVNNHIPLNVAQLRGGWDNGACAWRSTASSTYQVCDQMPALTGAILDATFEPNQSATIGVTYTQSYCHTLTNRGTDERFTIRFPAGSEAWTQQLEVRTGSCAGTLVHTINQGGSYTTSLLTTGASLYLVHNIMPPNGTPDGEIDFTTITVESTTDSRFTRTVTDVTTAAAGTIEGVVFDDNNRNGIQDIGEVGIPGVTVTLYDFLFPVATATTNANGEYTFDGIAPGALYVVELDPDTLNDPVFVDPVGGYSNFLAVFAGATVVQDFAVDVSSTTPDTTSFLELVISPSSVAAGGSSTFTIRVNKSTTPPQLTNVVVTIVINGLLEVGTITQSQGTYTIAQGTHGLYFKDAAAQTAHTVTFDLDTVALGSTVTMTIPVTVSSSAAAQTLNHYANLTGNSGTGTVTASVGPVGLTITTTSAQATATAQQANANATSTAAAASSSSSSAGSSSAQTSADTLPLTGYVAQPEANAPIDVLANILSGIVTTLLVIAGLAIGTWGLLLYFERLPQSFIDRFGWLRNDRTWYTGSIAFTILMTLFIVLQVIAPPATGPQVAEVPAEAADTQAPVDVVAVSAAANRGEQPAAAPDATRHVKPPDPATRLLIPKLGIDTEVVEAQAIGNTWDVTTFYEEAAHLEGTAHLGTRGNAVIAGHVRTEKGLGLFRNAKQLEVGDQIIAKGDGVEYVYEVLWTETVKPSEMGVVAPSDEAILTLITCTDWDNAQWTYLSRIIVRAKLVEVRPIE